MAKGTNKVWSWVSHLSFQQGKNIKFSRRENLLKMGETRHTRHFSCLEVMPTPMKVKGVRGRVTMRVVGEKDKLVLEHVKKN